MALTTSTINSGRNGVTHMKLESSKMANECKKILDTFGANEDFRKFVTGTSYGQELADKLIKLLQVMQNQVCPGINSLAGATNTFLDRQEVLNNQSI